MEIFRNRAGLIVGSIGGTGAFSPADENAPVASEPRRRNFRLIRQDGVQRRVAVIDDDEGIRLYLQEVLTQQGFQVFEFPSAELFLANLDAKSRQNVSLADVILCDVRLPGIDGLSFVSTLRERAVDVPTILMTAYAEVQAAVRAMREGAYDYLEKPFDTTRLYSVLENAIRFRKLSYENSFLKNRFDPELRLTGVQCLSPSMRAIYDLVKRIASSETSALINGESGVGKEIIARAIHDNSGRAEKPFLALKCAEIPESLLELELFGHSRESSTGASPHRKGLFEQAEGGTLFFEDISELGFGLQAKVLRVFQDQKIRGLNEEKYRPVNVRVIASTRKNLDQEIRQGRFLEDLYYRLNAIPIHVPPLRQRREDIVLLAKYFLEEAAVKKQVSVAGFTPAALTKLVHQPWKENVRELQRVVERSLILSGGETLDESDIPVGEAIGTDDLIEGMAFEMPSLRDVERRYILSVLKKYNGKKDAAAKFLGMSRRTLYRKLTNQDGEEEQEGTT
jgi:DNA-binding NtrC family response regulator